MTTPRCPRGRDGFTLPEALVALILGLTILVGVYKVLSGGIMTQTTVVAQQEINRKAQVGMDEMVRILRGASQIQDAGTNRITVIDQDGNSVRFYLSGAQLMKVVNGSSYSGGQSIASNITNLSLIYYYLNAGARQQQQPPNLSQVNEVGLQLTAGQTGYVITLSSAARMRNKP